MTVLLRDQQLIEITKRKSTKKFDTISVIQREPKCSGTSLWYKRSEASVLRVNYALEFSAEMAIALIVM